MQVRSRLIGLYCPQLCPDSAIGFPPENELFAQECSLCTLSRPLSSSSFSTIFNLILAADCASLSLFQLLVMPAQCLYYDHTSCFCYKAKRTTEKQTGIVDEAALRRVITKSFSVKAMTIGQTLLRRQSFGLLDFPSKRGSEAMISQTSCKTSEVSIDAEIKRGVMPSMCEG